MIKKIICITIIINIFNTSCFIKTHNVLNDTGEDKWLLEIGKYSVTFDPGEWMTGPNTDNSSFGAYYNKVLYKKINNEWIKWVTLDYFQGLDMFYVNTFSDVLWEDDKYVYVIICTDLVEIEYSSYKSILTIYMISKEKKKILKMKEIECINEAGGSISHYIMKNGNSVIVIPDYSNDGPSIKMLYITSELKDDPKCILVEKSDLDGCPDLSEIKKNTLKINWINSKGENNEKIINIQ